MHPDDPTTLAATPFSHLSDALRLAAVRGANDTALTEEEERCATSGELLAAALCRIPDLAVAGPLLTLPGIETSRRGIELAAIAALARGRIDGCLRLTLRALEHHAREVGYDATRWIDHAVIVTGVLLDEAGCEDIPAEERPTPDDLVRSANAALATALAVLGRDRMAVPGQLADALGRLLALDIAAGACGTSD